MAAPLPIAQNHRLIPSISVFAFVFDQAVETVIRSFREFSGITRQKTHAINCLIHKSRCVNDFGEKRVNLVNE